MPIKKCNVCGGTKWTLYRKEKMYDVKTQEHEVIVNSTGLKAICYVYEFYYSITYTCDNCHAYVSETDTETMHSVDHY